jgi:malate synthase
VLDDGRKVTAEMVRALIPEELAKVKAKRAQGEAKATYDRAATDLRAMSTQDEFAEFLTLPLYEEIE